MRELSATAMRRERRSRKATFGMVSAAVLRRAPRKTLSWGSLA
jgi:hypothetical protein